VLSSARYARNKTRFVTVPPELDTNSSNPVLVHAALTAGLYPKILSVNNKNAELRTITNNQHAFFHPTSVNFGRNPSDFGVSYLSYFTLMYISLYNGVFVSFTFNLAGIRRNCMHGKRALLMILLFFYSVAMQNTRYRYLFACLLYIETSHQAFI